MQNAAIYKIAAFSTAFILLERNFHIIIFWRFYFKWGTFWLAYAVSNTPPNGAGLPGKQGPIIPKNSLFSFA